ncbi:hypothetical protein [Pseudarthrobacter sp. AB1]|uniref:hypothetical protein n=1 Tax=Pseudarthrobacter sp. AB1 TaxID=2138309 RepID=UPI001D04913E|nr:hypothetical protein [Pseudarthrobacter sp. AB1]
MDNARAYASWTASSAVSISPATRGEITSHRFYFDQVEFLSQVGLMRELSTH